MEKKEEAGGPEAKSGVAADGAEPVTATTAVNGVKEGKEEGPKKPDLVVFPSPCNWYRSTIAAARDDMWAYCAAGQIVLVYPKHSSDAGSRWPRFELMGTQIEKFTAVSFCQSFWEFLPVKGAPLVSGCEKGIVRVWNLEDKATVIYQDCHVGSVVAGVDWSICNHSVIYAIDDKGTMSVWNVIKNTLRTMSFGKNVPTCLKASPHEKDVVCFGTKGGNVLVVDVAGSTGKILAKVRHEEEVISTLWVPPGEWDVLRFFKGGTGTSNTNVPWLVSTTHSMKLPTIRVWSKDGADIGVLQAWERDNKIRPFKMFGLAGWAKDPNTGKLMLISSSRHGEIIMWKDGVVHENLHKAHTHNAIFATVQCGDVVWSLSYEPMIVGWNVKLMELECIIPTFKGSCCIVPSPIDSSRLAIGCSDHVMRILKCVAGYPNHEDVSTRPPIITHKMKGKVTSIAWHPRRDNCIAFGTDEGVLGIYEVKDQNKYAMCFERRMPGTVYTIQFGPSVYTEDFVRQKKPNRISEELQQRNVEMMEPASSENDNESADPSSSKSNDVSMLYACGGNSIFMVSPSQASNTLISVNMIIEKANKKKDSESLPYTEKMTELRWSPDYSILAVGFHDGRIELYAPPHLKLVYLIKSHLRAIQYLLWRPYDFNLANSSSTRYLASTSNDGYTRLYDLASLFQTKERDEDEEPTKVICSDITLQGHGIRVISCAFSPHDKDLLVTVAYDSTAIVWNISDGSPIARYMEHKHRLVACSFHPTDRFRLITLSDEQCNDFAVHVWDYREHPFRVSGPKSNQCKPLQPLKAANLTVGNTIKESTTTSMQVVDMTEKSDRIRVPSKANAYSPISKKPLKPKSLLPLTKNALVNNKCGLIQELEVILKKKNESTNGVSHSKTEQNPSSPASSGLESDPSFYLGLLGTPEECAKVMEFERSGHEEKKHYDEAAMISAWMGDQGWIEKAIKDRTVTETMVVIARSFSAKLFNEAAHAYIEQLIESEEYLKASTYFVIMGESEEALKLLMNQALYREAIALIKTSIPLSRRNEFITQVSENWAKRAFDDGNYELAAKIYASIGQLSNAIAVIQRKAHPYAEEAATFLSECQEKKKPGASE